MPGEDVCIAALRTPGVVATPDIVLKATRPLRIKSSSRSIGRTKHQRHTTVARSDALTHARVEPVEGNGVVRHEAFHHAEVGKHLRMGGCVQAEAAQL